MFGPFRVAHGSQLDSVDDGLVVAKWVERDVFFPRRFSPFFLPAWMENRSLLCLLLLELPLRNWQLIWRNGQLVGRRWKFSRDSTLFRRAPRPRPIIWGSNSLRRPVPIFRTTTVPCPLPASAALIDVRRLSIFSWSSKVVKSLCGVTWPISLMESQRVSTPATAKQGCQISLRRNLAN